jgi:hypothetical protein
LSSVVSIQIINQCEYIEFQKKYPNDPVFNVTPYTFIGRMCMGSITRWADGTEDPYAIRFVHELMANNKPPMELFQAFSEVKRNSPHLSRYLGGLCFEPKGSPFLQVADIMAHCAFVGLSGRWRDCPDDVHVRKNLGVILKSVHLDAAIFTAERLEETRAFRDALVAKGQEPDSDAPPTTVKF